jgi:hypothetical protein
MADAVHRLRLHGGGADTVAQRHRAEATLAGGLPRPRGLPAGAWLCVRRLALRLPGGALAGAARLAGSALQGQLDEAWRQAVRPGPSSPGAAVPALWFGDDAELLVFLARRARAGDTAAWWWAALAGRHSTPWAAVAQAWQGRPQAVPAAVLALGSDALPVAEALGTPACERVAQAVATSFGVQGWGVLPWTQHSVASQPQVAGSEATVETAPAAAPVDAHAGSVADVQMRRYPGETGPRARPSGRPAGPAHRLVALAQALARKPWAASSHHLIAEVERGAQALGPAAGRPAPRTAVQSAEDGHQRATSRDDAAPASVAPMGPGRRADLTESPTVEAPEPREALPEQAARPPQAKAAPETARCHTPHAGLFFLLPLLLRHGCYGDFTQPGRAGLALHPAWLLQALLRRCAPPVDGDPLPALLQAWAGGRRRPRSVTPWRPWFTSLVQALQADAAQRLARPPRGTLAWLVRQPGWVQMGASRLDVGFDLRSHPFAIRAAGLDRDVGWLPAAGRAIAFHFDTGGPA